MSSCYMLLFSKKRRFFSMKYTILLVLGSLFCGKSLVLAFIKVTLEFKERQSCHSCIHISKSFQFSHYHV